MTKFLDWFTKEIVGWNISLGARTAEWKEALDRALGEHFPWGVRERGLNLVSDNGSQPTSITFMGDMAVLGINQVFCFYDNSKGECGDEVGDTANKGGAALAE